MKTVMTFLILLCGTFAMQAQNIEPRFEKDGDLVKATYFHENGIVAQTGFFLNGELHGEWKMYNTDGKKVAMGEYQEGTKTGKWFFWDADNLKEVDYSNNAIVNVVNWNNATGVAVNR